MINIKTFNELTNIELYKIMKLRVDVFVVEQNCPYNELDNIDLQCYHLFREENGAIVYYLRIIPTGVKYQHHCSIGRVIVNPDFRGKTLGLELMKNSIDFAFYTLKAESIKLSGQAYLEKFYKSLGFEIVSEVYLEDDIPHIDMVLKEASYLQ